MPESVIGICGRCGGSGRIPQLDFPLCHEECPLCRGRGSIRVLKEIFDSGGYPLKVLKEV
jgi:DnaJ-class molecular chaperone